LSHLIDLEEKEDQNYFNMEIRKIKLQLIILLILFSISCFSQKTNLIWTEINERDHLKNRQDSATWDKDPCPRGYVTIAYLHKGAVWLVGTNGQRS
jgi:hypothetical protein